MVTEVVAVVPLGPITSTGSVTVVVDVLPVAVLELVELGVRVTVAAAVLVGSTTLVAVIVTVWGLPIVAGAVYPPFTRVPTAGLSDQVTAVLPAPVTEAIKVVDAPAASDTEPGPIVIPTGRNDTVAIAVLVESAALVAVTVTVCWLVIIGGA